MTNPAPTLFCAIDTADLAQAKQLVKTISSEQCGIKLGLEFFNAHGVQGVVEVCKDSPNLSLFLDLKYHDIPNTVAGAIRAVTQYIKPAFLNVHASGGLDMMQAARQACPPETKLLAVTVLTSIDADTLNTVGQGNNPQEQVKRLAILTKQAGLDGIVCSSHEIETVRNVCGDDFILMVPGIRPVGSDANDQKRVMTPRQAMTAGANHLVIGRPITQSDNPHTTIQSILHDIA